MPVKVMYVCIIDIVLFSYSLTKEMEEDYGRYCLATAGALAQFGHRIALLKSLLAQYELNNYLMLLGITG